MLVTSEATGSELRVDFGKIDSIGLEGLISISGSGIAWLDWDVIESLSWSLWPRIWLTKFYVHN